MSLKCSGVDLYFQSIRQSIPKCPNVKLLPPDMHDEQEVNKTRLCYSADKMLDCQPTGALALSLELLKLLLAKDTLVIFQILYGEQAFLTLGFSTVVFSYNRSSGSAVARILVTVRCNAKCQTYNIYQKQQKKRLQSTYVKF